jgi:serine/threonine protein kinase
MTIGKYKNALHHRDGLFSNIFRAEVPEDDQMSMPVTTVALKVTVPMAMEPPHNTLREARLLKRCQSDHIIPLLESFQQSGGRLVLVFPFMPYTLEGLVDQSSFSSSDRRSCLRDMFSALKYVHELGILHRDIKPSNVLLKSPSGPVYLADFGIAWAGDDEDSEPADSKITDVGTTCYRPPELMFGNTKYSTPLDLWAAGCVVAETVNGGQGTLFDSGDLGSELALIQSMFKKLGTPTTETWPVSLHSSRPDALQQS